MAGKGMIVIGCGRLGSDIASRSSEQGKSVTVIDNFPESFERLSDAFSGYKVLGSASNIKTLLDAGIDKANEIVITTGDDNLNLFLAFLSSEIYKIPLVYVRFDDPDKAALVAGHDIRAIYPFELSRNKFYELKREEEEDEEEVE